MKCRALTSAADDDRLDWMAYYFDRGCSCHISSPCGSCLHPGNPINQEEDESCWEPDFMDIDAAIEDARCRLVEANYAFWALQKLEMLSVFHDAVVRLELRHDQKTDSLPE